MISKGEKAVALVITLLMLSVITFLAIAFLSMTSRNRTSVTATLDLATAKSMSDAALARAQAEIIAQMMSTNDILNYDYIASHNYQSGAFNAADTNLPACDPANVNYLLYSSGGGPVGPWANPPPAQQWAQNIANLMWDPRPPVFVQTNANPPSAAYPLDFRYWVDINRNGMFESNGPVYNYDLPNPPTTLDGTTSNYNGEPEWIGVLRYPWVTHSATNQFGGRYAYMVLPIGKTLDLNYIYNDSKNQGLPPSGTGPDGYVRDQGIGSWELNFAATLNGLNTNMYPPSGIGAYDYQDPELANLGICFLDAVAFLHYRQIGYTMVPNTYPNSVAGALGITASNFNLFQNIDEFAASPTNLPPFDFAGNLWATKAPWPGSYNTNLFYDVQDLFDPNKTGTNGATRTTFASRFAATNAAPDTYDRYTMQRLLAVIGTGSAPEYGVYVYSNFWTNVPSTFPTVYRTKININFDNTQQIQNGPYSPMPTNLAGWAPLNFFTNAADLLLHSQEFPMTNTAGVYYNHFGLSGSNALDGPGIPIYNSTNASYSYSSHIHRLLQLAANIYECTSEITNFVVTTVNGIKVTNYYPHAYRPLFNAVNSGGSFRVNIVGYTPVLVNDTAYNNPYYDISDSNNIISRAPGTFNIWGIPWVVGAVKGLPSFNKFSAGTEMAVQRNLYFVRQKTGTVGVAATNLPPAYTNQFYTFSNSVVYGMDVWNPYPVPFPIKYAVYATNYTTLFLTNNYNAGFVLTNVSQYTPYPPTMQLQFPAWDGSKNSGIGFTNIMQTGLLPLTNDYVSEVSNSLVFWGSYNPTNYNGSTTLPPDWQQTKLPVHNWTLYMTNRVAYYMVDQNGRILDYVNLGPLVCSNWFLSSSFPGNSTGDNYWATSGGSDNGAGLSQGVTQQIADGENQDPSKPEFADSLIGSSSSLMPTYPANQFIFGCPVQPHYICIVTNTWSANDPIVHYTADDLTAPVSAMGGGTYQQMKIIPVPVVNSNAVGIVSQRYEPWNSSLFPAQASSPTLTNMLFKDPLITFSYAWQFPTNSFPSVGWLGRVHRGTPWQTVYLKSDNPNGTSNSLSAWATEWVYSGNPVDQFGTYPTNDWSLVDLFTAAQNDNAARGLLSVNQTNDAAWAAVFAGVVALSNSSSGVVGHYINPSNDVAYLLDAVGGINLTRTNYPNGLFHHIGDILQATNLTALSPYALGGGNDEMVERIPQETLGLLKVGYPQFVIYAWGQSLKPQNNSFYSGSGPPLLQGVCTNYQITGEFLSRTVCHVVSDPYAAAPKIVIDSYNIEPSD